MNHPAQAENQMGKRIVSKSEYVKVQAKRIGLGVSSGFLLFMATICFMLVVILCLALLESLPILLLHQIPLRYVALCGSGIVVFGLGSRAFLNRGAAVFEQVVEANTVIADLPAPGSLLRASQEPLQAQEAVLLRAAAETQERHEEQLVRASVGIAE